MTACWAIEKRCKRLSMANRPTKLRKWLAEGVNDFQRRRLKYLLYE